MVERVDGRLSRLGGGVWLHTKKYMCYVTCFYDDIFHEMVIFFLNLYHCSFYTQPLSLPLSHAHKKKKFLNLVSCTFYSTLQLLFFSLHTSVIVHIFGYLCYPSNMYIIFRFKAFVLISFLDIWNSLVNFERNEMIEIKLN